MEISPDGHWAAAAARSYDGENGFRLFLVDLDRGTVTEAWPTPAADERLRANHRRPGVKGIEWTTDGLRFPAPNVDTTALFSDFQHGRTLEQPGIALGEDHAWFAVSLTGGTVGALQLDDSAEAARRTVPIPRKVDSRIGVRVHSQHHFDLLDRERGGKEITSFWSYGSSLSLDSASVSPDGKWIVATVGWEVGFASGPRAFLIERRSGEKWLLEDKQQVFVPPRFRPGHRELYSVAGRVDRSAGQPDLIRWRY